jgi:HSP20 family molecular chaperone IbpA
MLFKDKRSFFERITGSVAYEEPTDSGRPSSNSRLTINERGKSSVSEEKAGWLEDESEEGELTVDVYQTPSEVVIQAMVAGVKPEDLNISITREMVTMKGSRERPSEVRAEDYLHQELYWGAFSRTIVLPAEVETEEAEAIERHGLLTIRLPKINKEKIQKIRVKSI